MAIDIADCKFLWDIYVPTVSNDGKPYRTRFHRVWDSKVRAITKGLSIFQPVKGQWINDDGELFQERMIPVRIACTPSEIIQISHLTAKYYKQQAIFYYRVSDHVVIQHYNEKFEPINERVSYKYVQDQLPDEQ